MPDPIEELTDLVTMLQARVDALDDEVRTRRVVVVDGAGRPRVVLSADPGVASVRVDAEDLLGRRVDVRVGRPTLGLDQFPVDVEPFFVPEVSHCGRSYSAC